MVPKSVALTIVIGPFDKKQNSKSVCDSKAGVTENWAILRQAEKLSKGVKPISSGSESAA